MFAFTVARRYLLSNRAQSALLVVGVALGVTAFVFITALIEGLAIRLTDEVTANSAHVSLEPVTRIARVLPNDGVQTEAVALVSTFQRQQIREWRSTVALLRQQSSVSAISTQITGSAFLVKGQAVAPVSVTAIEPENLDAIAPISSQIVDGQRSLGADGILIGAVLAETLGLSAGQPVLFRTDRGVERLLTIRGIFKTGVRSADERVAYLSLQTARPLFRLPEGLTNIEIKLEDANRAREVASFLHEAIGLVVVDVVTDRHANLHNDLMNHLNGNIDAAQGLYACAYRPTSRDEHPVLDIWHRRLTLGAELPKLPLYLKNGPCVPVDLQKTYMQTRENHRLN